MGLDEGILWKYLQIKNVPLKIYLTTFHSHKKKINFMRFSRILPYSGHGGDAVG